MKIFYRLLTGLILLVMASPLAVSQQKPESKTEPAHKLVQFQMALMKRGPKWTATESEETKRVHQQHLDYVKSMFDSGKAVLAGRVTDGGELDAVFIYRASSAEEAKAWAEADPKVVAGYRVPEMHPWWSEDIFGKPAQPMKLTQMFLAFLTRGEKWTPERTPATEELQKGHMANINKLAEMKKLIAAGPFGDNGRLRGIFVFRVASLEEAKALTATDPAVQAGRFAIEIYPWMVPEGVLP
ncbi:MAG TPA: YciI family protein [Pyrinomonadaceae bacterium]